MDEDLNTTAERFYTLLHYQLEAQMPRPGGIHIYSHGAMIENFKTARTSDGWILEMSKGVDYSGYAMGYKDDGSKRSPRGPLERINFQTIESCIKQIAAIVSSDIGGVWVNANRIY